MTKTYELKCDLTLLSKEIRQALKTKYLSATLIDITRFTGEDSYCQIDTYQVWKFYGGDYMTITICFFQPSLTQKKLHVMLSIFPEWHFFISYKIKIRSLQKVVEQVIHSHMT